jgi:tRNA dimethylallyltransferase
VKGRDRVIAIFGPTGVGKTEVAIAVADRLRAGGEDPLAVSADALQVYRGIETLTGAPSAAERDRLEHRLVSFLSVAQTFSVGEYMPMAHREIDAALAKGRTPIVVGGTGLYLRAALTDLDLRPPPPPELRERWQHALKERGARALHAELAERAPFAAASIAPRDSSRLVRALELLDLGEEPAAGVAGDESQLWSAETRHPTALVGLVMEREALYERIDARVDAMVDAGAESEVRRADAAGASSTARKALGFEDLLRGDVEGMKLRTRRYAKRQLTWMGKLSGVTVIDVTDRRAEDVAGEVVADRAA